MLSVSAKTKGRRSAPEICFVGARRLALGELERPAGLGTAVLLALDYAGVAGEEAALLEHAAQLRLEMRQRLRQAVAYSASLTGQPAARHRADHVVLAGAVGGDQRLLDQHP